MELLWTTDPLAEAVMDEFARLPESEWRALLESGAGGGSGRSSSRTRAVASIVPPIGKRSVLGRSRPVQSGRSNISSLPDGLCSACDVCVADHLQLARRQQAARVVGSTGASRFATPERYDAIRIRRLSARRPGTVFRRVCHDGARAPHPCASEEIASRLRSNGARKYGAHPSTSATWLVPTSCFPLACSTV